MNKFLLILGIVYLLSMVVLPAVNSNFDWNKIQNIWDRWQSLNVGVLALLSSYIAYKAATKNSDIQKKSRFESSKAFLPEALSELTEYSQSIAKILSRLTEEDFGSNGITGPLLEVKFPTKYREIFSRCIENSDSSVGTYLSELLKKLQLADATFRDVLQDAVYQKHQVDFAKIRVIFLQAHINQLFPFARGAGTFENAPIDRTMCENAAYNLKLDINTLNELDLDLQ